MGDEAAIDAALEDYETLEGGVKGELAAEKTKLDSFKTQVNSSRGSTAALRSWLEGLPENTKDNPYTVVYTGAGAAGALYNALGAGGKYVNLDLSQSRVTGFAHNTEAGRELVVELILPDTLEETQDSYSATASTFGGFSILKKVRSSGLLRLGDNAFSNCVNLEEIRLDEAAEIGLYAFQGCTGLT
ncbi:MAG: leucine-rich repeat domain-containing protein, partial [Treponema sp.]|nr:leucine-rich repeat domain-containing protein [Treponema sp.]